MRATPGESFNHLRTVQTTIITCLARYVHWHNTHILVHNATLIRETSFSLWGLPQRSTASQHTENKKLGSAQP